MKLPQVPDSLRRTLKWVGYPAFAVVVFALVLFASLPRERIQDRVEAAASQALGMDVQIGDLGLTLFGPGVSLTSVTLKTRPLPPEKPQRYLLDDLTLHVGVFAAMRGRLDASFDGHVAGGSFDGEWTQSPADTTPEPGSKPAPVPPPPMPGMTGAAMQQAPPPPPMDGALTLDLSSIGLKHFPFAAGGAGPPVDGDVGLKVDLSLPKMLVAQAKGSIELSCDSCTVGDGKWKLIIPTDPMLAQGVTFPKLKLGKLEGAVKLDKGRATLSNFRARSPDAELEVDGYVELRDPIASSPLHLFVRFKPSEALAKREPTIDLLVNVMGNIARRPDGSIGFAVEGTIGFPRPYPSREPPVGVSLGHGPPATATSTAPPRPTMPPPPRPMPMASPTFAVPPPPRVAEAPPPPPAMPPPPAINNIPPPVTNSPENGPPPQPHPVVGNEPPMATPEPSTTPPPNGGGALPIQGLTNPALRMPGFRQIPTQAGGDGNTGTPGMGTSPAPPANPPPPATGSDGEQGEQQPQEGQPPPEGQQNP